MENNDILARLKAFANGGLAAPIALIALLSMVVLPLPPFMLDMLFSFNIALSLVIMLASIYVLKPLHFAAFPSILLIATFLSPYLQHLIPHVINEDRTSLALSVSLDRIVTHE